MLSDMTVYAWYGRMKDEHLVMYRTMPSGFTSHIVTVCLSEVRQRRIMCLSIAVQYF
jgi:hypothetical protein